MQETSFLYIKQVLIVSDQFTSSTRYNTLLNGKGTIFTDAFITA